MAFTKADKLDQEINRLTEKLRRLKNLREEPDFKIGKIYSRAGTDCDYAFIDWNGQIRLLNISNSTMWKSRDEKVVRSSQYTGPNTHKVIDFPMWAAIEAFSCVVRELTLKQ